jgi:sulfhydrogenase subunit beta (sulfur reductase)
MENTTYRVKLQELDRFFFDRSSINVLISHLQEKCSVFAPHEKGTASFAYQKVENPENVVLDYSRTIQPLKKFFLPPKETLLTFNTSTNAFDMVSPKEEEKIFFAVHSYELKAIQLLDIKFEERNPESNYLSRRENSHFIGISYETDKHHFSTSLGLDVEYFDGFSLFLEKQDDGYLLYVINEDGKNLLKGFPLEKYKAQKALIVHNDVPKSKLRVHHNRLPEIFEHVYHSKVWDEVSKKCLACGTCNLLCPTCYCFDVNDEIELDATTGKRERTWDSCMLNAFAEVAGDENFREKRADRTRHRLFRKFKYQTDVSSELHCVGCGRCSKFCPADISIIDIVNSLTQEVHENY